MPNSDICSCGHEEHEHVYRNHRNECTVCTCDDFDWDIDAPTPSTAQDCPECGYLLKCAKCCSTAQEPGQQREGGKRVCPGCPGCGTGDCPEPEDYPASEAPKA